MHNPVAAALASVTLGPEVVVDNLTMIPLLARNSAHLPPRTSHLEYDVLDDALASGETEITEISEEGSVPDLKLVNRGATPVLIIDGEELLGAKQNRIVNLTILVAARSELTIPVSCVEAGRWRARSRAFTSAPRTQYASGRAKRMAHVSYSMTMRGDRASDQADVWDDIAEKSVRLHAASPTSAMEAIYRINAASLDRFVAACQPIDRQVGAIFAVNGTTLGFDLFDRPETLRKMLPKLVRSVAVEALDDELRAGATASADSPHHVLVHQAFLASVATAPQHVVPALGVGVDVRLTTPHLAGAALVFDDDVVHLSAFAL